MRSVCGTVGVICGSAALVLGCGGGGGRGASVPLDELATQYASVFCHKAFTCCDAAELAGGSATSVDEATCRSIVAPQVTGNLADDNASIAAGWLAYHGDSARRCFDLLAALACGQWGADEELARFPDCLHIFEGLIAPTGPCTRDEECADGFCDTTLSGVCRARPKRGEYCPSGLCTEGSVCVSNAATGALDVCVAPLSAGSPCSFNSQCASASCNIDTATNTASCGPLTFCNGV